MRFDSEKYDHLITIIVSLLAGLSVYFFLSYLFVARGITIPISAVMSLLVYGLTRYYMTAHLENDSASRAVSRVNSQNNSYGKDYYREKRTNLSVPFASIFSLLILISLFGYDQDFHVFTNWNNISVLHIIQLVASIALCFFIPGYAIVLVITKYNDIHPLLSVLLAYVLSMLISGLTAYISALTFDVAVSESRNLFIAVYLIVLATFLIIYPHYKITRPINLKIGRYLHFHSIENRISKYRVKYKYELLIFGSLFSIIVISTYYLYDGVTIGDQWYHQGRSLLFMSGAFKEASITGAETFYPPFQSALLAALTVLSGVPVVNAYASIAFLNVLPVFGFLYFFYVSVPLAMRKASLLACSLFTLSSGFGWIYLLTTAATSDILSVQSSMETLRNLGHLDIVSASNFMIATAPDFSTGLIYMALPAGFVLLAMIRTSFQKTSTKVAIIATISILGALSHYEFYIFIIIASMLPIVFRLKAGNSIYLGLFSAFFMVYLIDILAPGSYLSSLKISGIPLLLLAVSFVTITWLMYLGYRRFHMTLGSILSFCLANKFQLRVLSENFYLVTLIVALSAFLYLFCFIVLSQLPLNTIIDQTSNNTYPWYLYPMKMGTAGLFGLAFVLSYFFKKFEKHVFVFGVIMLVSFFAGPYYDEHRFSKYFMAGMIGFASIMIYAVLSHKFTNKPLVKSVLVAVIITSSSLSVLLFIGYNSLILQAQDFTNTLYRRHFPDDSDLRLYEFLHNKTNINSKYNVITFLKEYDRGEDGVISKISSFAGLPYDKLRQDPLTLNSSTIESLYYHLWYSDAQYVIVSKDIFNTPSIVTDSTRFVIDHFPAVYKNDNYVVLEVPPLDPPDTSSDAKVALVYEQGLDLQEPRPSSNTTLLGYNSSMYNLDSKNDLVSVQKDNKSERLNLSGSISDRGISIWTRSIDHAKRANYIETEFRITNENENKANDVRLEWQEGGSWDYYVKLSDNGLELYKKSDRGKGILLKNSDFDKLNWKWYTLTIQTLSNSINIFVDNVLKMQVPKITANNIDGITKIGLTSFYNDVQFGPVKIGTITNTGDALRTSNYDYNYPLTFLALNKIKYETYSSNDLTVFSKDTIVIPDSILSDNATINRYLEYVRFGGTLVVLNSNGNFSSMASKYFLSSSNQSDQEAFTHIYNNTNQKVTINMPGWINKTNAQTLPDVHVRESYRNDKNDTIAPFIVEKKIPTGGKIILVNSQGLFNTISNFPKQYFPSMSNISLPLPLDKTVPQPVKNNSLPIQGYIGKMKISGMVTLNSSSLLLNEGINTFPINASRVTIFNDESKIPTIYEDVTIKDMKLMGDYHLNINFSGQSELPGSSSYHDYIDMNIPTGFNMSVNLDSKSGGQIDFTNYKGLATKSVNLHNNSKVEFYEMRTNTTFPLLLKEPKLSVDGNVYIDNAYLAGYLTARGKLDLGAPIDLQGRLTTNFAFVDNFYQPYYNATKIQYITYLQSLTMDGKLVQDKKDPKLPGDIYFESKEKVPLVKIFRSPINIIFMSALIIVVILLSKYIWKKKLQRWK